MRKNKFDNFLIHLYIIVELVLLVIIKKTEHQGHTGIEIDNVCMFLAIVVNTLVVLYYYLKYGIKREEQHENLVVLALILNLFADFFLSLLNTNETMLAGFTLFCTVEAVYALYLRSPKSSIIARVVLFALGCIVAYDIGLLSFVNVIGILNLSIIFFNTIDAWRANNIDPGIMFKVGIMLFCISDYCILLRSLTDGVIYDVVAFLVWVTYVPAQVLIVLNYIKKNGNNSCH